MGYPKTVQNRRFCAISDPFAVAESFKLKVQLQLSEQGCLDLMVVEHAFFRGGFMVLGLFESADQRRKDNEELAALRRKYSDEMCTVLASRADDESLSDRDRRHWSRLLRKARSRSSD